MVKHLFVFTNSYVLSFNDIEFWNDFIESFGIEILIFNFIQDSS